MLHLYAGRWTCLLGNSGVGKSTLLRLIAGLDTEGKFTGTLQASDNRPLTGRIAYMAQSDLLFPWLTVQKNVALGAKLRMETPDLDRVNYLIQQVGLEEHATKKSGQLSGGMRQRCALARTLMEDTPVVLLDEPFSALDPTTRKQMQELSCCMLNGKTVLLVTHDLAEALRLGDQLYTMSEKKLESYSLEPSQTIRRLDDPAVMTMQAKVFNDLYL